MGHNQQEYMPPQQNEVTGGLPINSNVFGQNMASLAINKINILPGLTLIQITFEYDQYSTGNNVGETFNQHISCKDHRFDETEYKNMLNHSRNMPSPLPADWTTYFYTVTNDNNEILYGLSDLMYSTYINNVYDMNSSSYTIYKNSVSTNSPLTNTNSQVDKYTFKLESAMSVKIKE